MKRQDKPQPLVIETQHKEDVQIKKVTYNQKKMIVPPSPRIDLETTLDYSFLGMILGLLTILASMCSLYILLFDNEFYIWYYCAFILLLGPVTCCFVFLNWLGLKYFKQN